MAYTASALSFMLEGLNKPVILTGSQLPIGVLRTDGKENLLTSIEIATDRHSNGQPIVPEVCIFFENHLMRGNRTTKMNAENFNAFRSFNYPVLASAGIHIKYNNVQIHTHGTPHELEPHYLLDTNIAILKLFPGIQENVVAAILATKGLKAVVLETYGSGNAPRKEWFLRRLHDACEQGIIIVNVTQCSAGTVEMERYETGYQLMQAGVVCGYDSTTESAVTKADVPSGARLSACRNTRTDGTTAGRGNYRVKHNYHCTGVNSPVTESIMKPLTLISFGISG